MSRLCSLFAAMAFRRRLRRGRKAHGVIMAFRFAYPIADAWFGFILARVASFDVTGFNERSAIMVI